MFLRLSENTCYVQTQYMLDQLTDLQGKEHILLEANRALSMKVYKCHASLSSLSPLQFLIKDQNFIFIYSPLLLYESVYLKMLCVLFSWKI